MHETDADLLNNEVLELGWIPTAFMGSFLDAKSPLKFQEGLQFWCERNHVTLLLLFVIKMQTPTKLHFVQ